MLEYLHAVSWTWMGASALAFAAAAASLFLLKDIKLAILCAALGLGIGYLAKVFTDRDIARVEAKQAGEERDKAVADLAAFVDETARLGKLAQEKANAKIAEQQKVNDDLGRKLLRLGAFADELSRDRERLRLDAIRRPDGSSVPTSAVGPQGAAGAPAGECVPATDYRELEARSAYDARTVKLWSEWADRQGLTTN